MILGEKLNLLIKQNGYSQEELADKLHIARQTVSKRENGLAVPELDGLVSSFILTVSLFSYLYYNYSMNSRSILSIIIESFIVSENFLGYKNIVVK